MLTVEEAAALRYIRECNNREEQAVYDPTKETWVAGKVLRRLHRKKLVAGSLNYIPTPIWITTAGVEALEAANG